MSRRVLITGANKGIGKATVEAALEESDVYVLLGSRNLGRGEEARAEIIARHPDWADRLEVLQIDVSDGDSVASASGAVAKAYGESDALYGIVNNAGIGHGHEMGAILEVNTYGPRRVCEALVELLQEGGRIVNVSSASGPNYVAECSASDQALLTDPDVTWADIDTYAKACLAEESQGSFDRGNGSAYGLSKALLNAYTLLLAREFPDLVVNACTPGFIETDLTREIARQRGSTPEEMGMKSPSAGANAPIHLLFGDVPASGWYFGSDAKRSPLDRYRSPGDPPYEGPEQ